MTPIAQIDSSMIANRDQLRAVSYAANGYVTVDFDDIEIRYYPDGRKFNRRTVFAGLEELAGAIDSEGQHEPFKVDILADGRILLNDGERRWLATKIIRSWSPEKAAKFAKVKVLVNDKNMTDVDRVIQQHNSNNGGDPFPIMDEAQSFKELRDGLLDGKPMTATQIAVRLGKNVPYVDGRLRLADASDEEKELIIAGMVNPTTVVALTRVEADPVKRVARIKEANSKGEKLKFKNVNNAPGVTSLQEIIQMIDTYLNQWEPKGVHKNIFLDIRSKANGVIKTIE